MRLLASPHRSCGGINRDPYSLMVKSPEGAASAMRVTASLSGTAVDVMKYDPENNSGVLQDSATEVVSASDAAFTIDGIAVTRSSNTITDLFSGITVELDDVSAGDLGTNQTISSRYSETDALGILRQLSVRSTIYCRFCENRASRYER